MKRLLPVLIALSAVTAQAQAPISAYYGTPQDQPEDGVNARSYSLLTSDTPLDQSATGENLTWDFTDLTEIGFSNDFVSTPTEEEFEEYTSTVKVVTKTSTVGPTETVSKAYFYENAVTAFTGVEAQGLTLNFSDDNANVGHFPLSYGSLTMDESAGTYSYNEFSGSFTGTITTHVDAYGTLTTDDAFGGGMVSAEVTRVKIVQTLSLNYLIFTGVGTVTQTTYHYFRATDMFPYFSTTTMTISIPSFDIDQTISGIEHASPAILSSPDFQTNDVAIMPNPASDVLTISSPMPIRSLTVYDMSAKKVLEQKSDDSVNVSMLSDGHYLINIQTDSGPIIRRFVKN